MFRVIHRELFCILKSFSPIFRAIFFTVVNFSIPTNEKRSVYTAMTSRRWTAAVFSHRRKINSIAATVFTRLVNSFEIIYTNNNLFSFESERHVSLRVVCALICISMWTTIYISGEFQKKKKREIYKTKSNFLFIKLKPLTT